MKFLKNNNVHFIYSSQIIMGRHMKKIFLITVSFVLLSFQVFSASLDIGRDQDSIHMDPILVSQNADVWVLNNMHSLIVRNNRDATGIEPDLAESWDISSDGKTYTFNLRDNLKFNDGTPLKSTDAKFSIERLRDGEGSVFGSMFGIIDAATAINLSFITVAIWWGVFSLPIMIFVKEPINYSPISITKAISAGWSQLLKTIKEIRHLKVVSTFLLAYWLYIDGVDTIIRMAVDYGTSIGFTASSLITALLLVQFIAFPATLVFNWYSSKIGIKNAIYTAIIGYSTITIFAALVKEEWHFYILAVMIACFQGGIQALSRSMYARIIPIEKAAQFYGFYNMLGKFAAIIGPPLMGYVGLVTGNPRIGILSIVILFISGGLILRKVDLDEGEKIAKAYLSKE